MTTAPARRFPPLEPEPPPPGLRTRLLRAGLPLAVLALVVAAVVLVGRRDHAGPAVAAAAPARVVVLDGRSVALATPDGRVDRVVATDADVDPQVVDLAVAPGGREGVLTAGQDPAPGGLLVDLAATSATAPVPAAPADLLAGAAVAEQPWADGGKALLLQRGAGQDVLTLVAAGSASSRVLGRAVVAAADPTGPGVVAATGGAALPQPDRGPGPRRATAARVELLRAGAPPVVLITAQAFAQAVGLPAGPVVVDRLLFSPDGSRVLVSGWSASAGDSPSSGLVVVDRSGHTVGVVRSRRGTSGNWAAWSPDGATLALGTYRETATLFDPDRLVELWDLRSAPRTVVLPGELRGAAQEPCVWAPEGGRLLCGDGRGWFDVDARAGTARPLAGTGRPLAWLAP